jgi:hypothetical protein
MDAIDGKDRKNESEECKKLRQERDKLKQDFDTLNATPTAADRVRDLDGKLEALIEALNNTSSDTKDKLEKIKKIANELPKNSPLSGPLKKVATGLKGTAEQMALLKTWLEKYHEYVHKAVESYNVAESGSAADQIRDFQKFFDKLRKDATGIDGIDEIDGLNDFFQFYSDAIASIAKKVDQIEASNRQRLQLPEELGGGSLERPHKTERERRADILNAMEAKLGELDQQIAQAGCDSEPADDPCRTTGRVAEDVAQTKKLADQSETGINLKLATSDAAEHFNLAVHGPDEETRNRAKESYYKDKERERVLQQQYNRQFGNLLNLASQSWSADDKKVMEKCYPYYSSLGKNR